MNVVGAVTIRKNAKLGILRGYAPQVNGQTVPGKWFATSVEAIEYAKTVK